jgi:hypothetical protein
VKHFWTIPSRKDLLFEVNYVSELCVCVFGCSTRTNKKKSLPLVILLVSLPF